ncbi:MAG: PAS domain-containing sensor histidine kinase, partial [bacterium]
PKLRVTLIRAPRHEIEKAFNRLAQNQREILFGLEIERIVDMLHSQADDPVVVERFLRAMIPAVRAIYPFVRACAYRYVADENHFVRYENGDSPEKDGCPSPASEASWPGGEDPLQVGDGGACAIRLESGEQRIGGIQCWPAEENRFSHEDLWHMCQEIKKQAENGLARAFTRSRALTQERNRFGINLATNMGHDLTNIIASGKWDLDTIRRAHRLGIVSMDPAKGTIYLQAVEGLENNLHFLQEMVDIYRSFGYTRRPRYERVDLMALIQELADLFQLSSSQRISIQVVAGGPLETAAEPRLLRMALFNLLANAAQAIRNDADFRKQGIVQIQTRMTVEGKVIISIQDNGPGIRDPEGRLLPDSEIGRIFQSGYSTKDQSSGGGLGLSWVKSIIEDFHDGSIQAVNRPEGGACFTLTFPAVAVHPPAEM